MNVDVTQGAIQEAQADTLIVNLFRGVRVPGGATGAVDKALDGAIRDLIDGGDLSGEAGEVVVLYPRGTIPARRVLVVGLGEEEGFDLEGVRRAAAAAIREARRLKAKSVASILHGAGSAGFDAAEAAQAVIEGTLLASYRYEADKQETDRHEVEAFTLIEFEEEKVEAMRSGLETAVAIAAGVTLARDLVNMPPNVATPTKLADVAEDIAQAHGMAATIGDREWAHEHQMGAFLAVAQGAGEPPKFIVLEHNGDREELDTLVLVGKGITFDTGGISLKNKERMGLMKSDMGGAAAVLGAMKVVGMLDLPLRIIGVAPCTENMPDAHAYRPADVITASNGKTIEIISTDAEGRMALADGLTYAKRYQPTAVIDLATLTGSCVTALGLGMAAGLFSNEDGLRDKLVAAGTAVHERVWPLPLWDDYREKINSDVADMKNSGGRMGGVATSAIFLKEFIDYPWAHLDIAGVAFGEKAHGYTPAGGAGFGVRLLVQFLQNWE
jgi:leucyl aminopeptidase